MHGCGRERRDIRRPAGKERRGYKERCRAVFHAARFDHGDGRMRPARADENHRRSRLRHGRLFPASYDYICQNQLDLDKEQKEFLKNKTFFGNEIVAGTRRLALMNMFLHNIGDIDGDNFISPTDALVADDGQTVRLRAGQSAVREKEQPDIHQRRRRTGKRGPDLQPAGFLGDDEQQAAKLCPAHPAPCSKQPGKPPSLCRTMFCLKAEREKRSENVCLKPPICTRSCACRPASFMLRASRQM